MRRRPRSTAALGLVLAVALLVGGAAIVPSSAAAAATGPSPPGDCPFPVQRVDASGTTVTVPAAPARVVVLHASAAQTMWEIGAKGDVVGMPVSPYTAYLNGSRSRTNVVGADDYSTNVEAVVNLSPDLVLAPNVTPPETVRALRRDGLTVYTFRKARTVEDVYAKTRLTGRLTGHCQGAAERVAWMRERIGRVRAAVAGEPRPTVLYPLGGGIVAGNHTFLNQIIRVAGGRNLAAEAGVQGYRQLSAEEIVSRQPAWLILNEGLPRSALRMDAYNRTPAVREGHLIRVDPNETNQPAPRIVYAIEHVARALHPAAMAAANGTATPTATTTSAPTTTATAPATPTPGQPGFGLVAGLLALAIAALAVGRRDP